MTDAERKREFRKGFLAAIEVLQERLAMMDRESVESAMDAINDTPPMKEGAASAWTEGALAKLHYHYRQGLGAREIAKAEGWNWRRVEQKMHKLQMPSRTNPHKVKGVSPITGKTKTPEPLAQLERDLNILLKFSDGIPAHQIAEGLTAFQRKLLPKYFADEYLTDEYAWKSVMALQKKGLLENVPDVCFVARFTPLGREVAQILRDGQ